jgi:hypothetical protein
MKSSNEGDSMTTSERKPASSARKRASASKKPSKPSIIHQPKGCLEAWHLYESFSGRIGESNENGDLRAEMLQAYKWAPDLCCECEEASTYLKKAANSRDKEIAEMYKEKAKECLVDGRCSLVNCMSTEEYTSYLIELADRGSLGAKQELESQVRFS